MTELKQLQRLFGRLISMPRYKFPLAGGSITAPTDKGVYVIYGPRRKPSHVGGTPRARNGIAQRLRDHLAGRSSFVIKYLDSDPSRLRGCYEYQCLAVPDKRIRALLEAYAIGQLCPAHIGHGLEQDAHEKAG